MDDLELGGVFFVAKDDKSLAILREIVREEIRVALEGQEADRKRVQDDKHRRGLT